MRGKPFYLRLAIGSFLLAPASYIAACAVLLAYGDRPPPGAVPGLVVAGAVFALAAGLLAWSTRFLIPALLLALFFTLVAFVGRPVGGLRLEGFFDFTIAVVTFVAGIGAVVGCVVSLAQRRRGALRGPRPVERVLAWTVPCALVAICAASALITYTHSARAEAPPGSVVVTLHGTRFEPSTIHAAVGEPTRVFAVNEDPFAHTFTVDALGVDEYVAPRSHRLITFTVTSTAHRALELTCEVTGHGDMTGTIVVAR